MKKCNTCTEWLDTSAFARCSSAPDGLQWKCKACTNRISLAWNKANKDRVDEMRRARRAADLDGHRQAERAKYHANKTASAARAKRWKDKNRETLRTQWREWNLANPGAGIARQHKRRAAKKQNGGSFTVAQAAELRHSYLNKCAYCFAAVSQHLDHIVAIARGGSSNIENIAPACSKCNLSKGPKSLLEFLVHRKAA